MEILKVYFFLLTDLPSEQGQHDLDQTTSSQVEDEEVNEEEIYNPSDNGEVVEEEESTGVVIDEVPNNSESNVATAQEEMPKKSYASIVSVKHMTIIVIYLIFG